MSRAKVTSKGQITIPIDVRDKLKIEAGQILEFAIRDDGTVVVAPLNLDASKLYGFLAKKSKKVASTDEMLTTVKKSRAKAFKRE